MLAANEQYYITKNEIRRLDNNKSVHSFSDIKIKNVRAYSNGFFIQTNARNDVIFTINSEGEIAQDKI